MPIIIAVLLAIILALIFRLGNGILKIKICPICAGVSSTWLILTAGILLGVLSATNYLLPITIMMGGSVVGISYQAEKRFAWASALSGKVLVVAPGFMLVYLFILNMSWPTLVVELMALLILAYLFFLRIPEGDKKTPASTEVQELEKKMEECC